MSPPNRIVQAYLDGYTVREIAEAFGMSYGAVHRRLGEGRVAMRRNGPRKIRPTEPLKIT